MVRTLPPDPISAVQAEPAHGFAMFIASGEGDAVYLNHQAAPNSDRQRPDAARFFTDLFIRLSASITSILRRMPEQVGIRQRPRLSRNQSAKHEPPSTLNFAASTWILIFIWPDTPISGIPQGEAYSPRVAAIRSDRIPDSFRALLPVCGTSGRYRSRNSQHLLFSLASSLPWPACSVRPVRCQLPFSGSNAWRPARRYKRPALATSRATRSTTGYPCLRLSSHVDGVLIVGRVAIVGRFRVAEVGTAEPDRTRRNWKRCR